MTKNLSFAPILRHVLALIAMAKLHPVGASYAGFSAGNKIYNFYLIKPFRIKSNS